MLGGKIADRPVRALCGRLPVALNSDIGANVVGIEAVVRFVCFGSIGELLFGRAILARALGISDCAALRRIFGVPSMIDSLEVRVLYPA